MKNNDMKGASVSSRKRPNYIRTNSNTLQPKFTCSRNLDAVSIGARLSQTRKGLGVTQEEMAKALFISPPGFRKLENGIAWPSGQVLVRLHDVYGIDITWLLYGIHSSYMDILIAISTQDDSRKFDLFTRLYSYFSVEHDPAVFSPSRNNECKNVDHFATWVDGIYLPSEQIAEEDTDVIAGSNAIPYDKGIYFEKNVTERTASEKKAAADADPEK